MEGKLGEGAEEEGVDEGEDDTGLSQGREEAAGVEAIEEDGEEEEERGVG